MSLFIEYQICNIYVCMYVHMYIYIMCALYMQYGQFSFYRIFICMCVFQD